MEALITLLTIIFISIVINKIATAALQRTGLPKDVASFQAQSAFSGVGFTTSESEYVVNHPVRRRIIRLLILLGSAGFSGVVATLILTFINKSAHEAGIRLLILLAGLLLLYLFASSKRIDHILGKVIEWGLDRFTSIRVVDYESLLGVGHGYTVASFTVSPESWVAGKTLRSLRLKDEGILVLGIYRRTKDGEVVYIGAPGPDTIVLPGDELIVYGHEEAIASLSKRLRGTAGDLEHERMVRRHHARKKAEEAMGAQY
ncbi:MAG: TrkA C-terminal domain-containing protein [Desulfurococcales archaeon]|nr:TrkA C-terminal domain-containing protein [Desulfurococcales archaeon]